MNLRLISKKEVLDKEISALENIFQSYIFMLADKDELEEQLLDERVKTKYNDLQNSMSFPILEEKEIAMLNDKWAEWSNLKKFDNSYQTFRRFIDDTTIKLIFMKKSLHRCAETKEYEDLLNFLNTQSPENLQKELLEEEHRLTKPVQKLYDNLSKLEEFSVYYPVNKSQEFYKKILSSCEVFLSLLSNLQNEIAAFNSKDGIVNKDDFLRWRNPSL